MSKQIDYSPADLILAKIAARDMGLRQTDIDILRMLADKGATEQGLKEHIRRRFPGWEGRSNAIPAILDAVKRGLDLED